MSHSLWKGKKLYRHLTVRFTKEDASITEQILRNELKRYHNLVGNDLVIVEKERMTDRLFNAWKHERGRFVYYGGDIKKKPAFQYDIYVRTEISNLVKNSVR